MFVIAYNSHFESTTKLSMELAKIDSLESTTDLEKRQKKILEKQIEIGTSNKNFYMKVIGVSLGSGIVIMIFGFVRWHYKVQRQIDKMNTLKIRQLESELLKMEKRVPFRRRG